MNKNKLFVVLFALLCLAALSLSASANQVGNDRSCNIDQYGCWIDAEDGGHNYIMFWTEEAREFFMGPKTEPFTNVVQKYTEAKDGKLPLEDATPNRVIIRYVK